MEDYDCRTVCEIKNRSPSRRSRTVNAPPSIVNRLLMESANRPARPVKLTLATPIAGPRELKQHQQQQQRKTTMKDYRDAFAFRSFRRGIVRLHQKRDKYVKKIEPVWAKNLVNKIPDWVFNS